MVILTFVFVIQKIFRRKAPSIVHLLFKLHSSLNQRRSRGIVPLNRVSWLQVRDQGGIAALPASPRFSHSATAPQSLPSGPSVHSVDGNAANRVKLIRDSSVVDVDRCRCSKLNAVRWRIHYTTETNVGVVEDRTRDPWYLRRKLKPRSYAPNCWVKKTGIRRSIFRDKFKFLSQFVFSQSFIYCFNPK